MKKKFYIEICKIGDFLIKIFSLIEGNKVQLIRLGLNDKLYAF